MSCRNCNDPATREHHAIGPLCDYCFDVACEVRGETQEVQGANDPHPVTAGSSLNPQPSTLHPNSTPAEGPEVEWLLSEHDAGRIDAPPKQLPPLPDGATSPMRKVADFYALVVALRQWAGDDRPVPFASAWVAGKLRLPDVTVWRALKALVAAGVLADVGSLPGRGKRGTKLYAPGTGAELVDLGGARETREAAG